MAKKCYKVNKNEIHQYYRKLHLIQALLKFNSAASLLQKAHIVYRMVTLREIVLEITCILH